MKEYCIIGQGKGTRFGWIIMIIFLAFLSMGNVAFSETEVFEVASSSFDASKTVLIQFTKDLDQTVTLDVDDFSIYFTDLAGTSFPNATSAIYNGSNRILLTLDGPDRPYDAKSLVSVGISAGAVQAADGTTYNGEMINVKSTVAAYFIETQVRVDGTIVDNDTILSGVDLGASSVTADLEVTVYDHEGGTPVDALSVSLESTTKVTNASGQVVFSDVTIDASLKTLKMNNHKSEVVTLVPEGSTLLHTQIEGRTRTTTASYKDSDDKTITAQAFKSPNYNENYTLISQNAARVGQIIQQQDEISGLNRCYYIPLDLDLKDKEVYEIQIDLKDRSNYTIVSKTKEDVSTTVDNIDRYFIYNASSGQQIAEVNLPMNLVLPQTVEFWTPTDILPEDFSMVFSGKLKASNDFYVYYEETALQKGVNQTIALPDLMDLKKIYDIPQTDFPYGDAVYEYPTIAYYPKGDYSTKLAESQLFLYAYYPSYTSFESDAVYQLLEMGASVEARPLKTRSIILDTARNSYYYFGKTWGVDATLPVVGEIGLPLTIKASEDSIQRGETQTFTYETTNGYTLDYFHNYNTGVSTLPSVVLKRDGMDVETVQGESFKIDWATDADTQVGSYTASIADAGLIPIDSDVNFSVTEIVPETPVLDSATAGDGAVTLKWHAVDHADGYKVYATADSTSSGIVAVTVTGTEATVSGLTNNQAYYFRVAATHGSVQSGLSNQISATPVFPVPDAPILDTAKVEGDDLILAWGSVSDVVLYKIYVDTGSGLDYFASTTDTTVSFTSSDLAKGRIYEFAVSAVSAHRESELSNSILSNYVTLPGMPTNVYAVSRNRGVRLTFDAPEDNGGTPLTGYVVTVYPSGETHAFSTTSSVVQIDGLDNGTPYTFGVQAVNAVGEGLISTVSNSVVPARDERPAADSKTTKITENEENSSIWINGVEEKIGKQEVIRTLEQVHTIVYADKALLMEKLEDNPISPVISLRDTEDSDQFTGTFDGEMIEMMKDRNATIEIVMDHVVYTLPVRALDFSEFSGYTETTGIPKDTTIEIQIQNLSEIRETVSAMLSKLNGSLVGNPMAFSIVASQGDDPKEISRFTQFVPRRVQLPEGGQITTAVTYREDGTIFSVPTKVTIVDGIYYAEINSLTNSSYALVWHPLHFEDTQNHWAQASIDELGARYVVDGVGDLKYAPDFAVTKAEFITALVKAIGLPTEGQSASKWYLNYASTAKAYGLIDDALIFGDLESEISRESAMVMLNQAVGFMGIASETLPETDQILSAYADADMLSDAARQAAALCIDQGLIQGYDESGVMLLKPYDPMTRAEMAAVLMNLLKTYGLI